LSLKKVLRMVSPELYKKGEVVDPAGGETGVPRCLAEDYMLLKAALSDSLERP